MPEPDIRSKQYTADLSATRRRPVSTEVEAVRDLVVEDVETGFCGAVIRVEKMPGGPTVTLEDRLGKHRVFPLGPGFWIDGRPVTLIAPKTSQSPATPQRTASGSIAVPKARARVARAGRIYVEGRHDAELVEKVWGDDLRVEGVVVEYLEGVDDLAAIVDGFRPGPDARLGVLVDHLVPGTKEARIVEAAMRSAYAEHLLVVGHPYIDVWEAVKPAAVGIQAWPRVPHGRPWKEGVCEALGWPVNTPAAWKRILRSVRDFRDLEPELLGRVEELIDFVTSPGA
ncbi:DUF3097 domain-containing protein [Catenulispora sp. NF23]|uniref:DUF3097 domain-containing protein n=1 Tax=Catenulispora pinistramenti TaxID=2705254 RepID=A0ABS5KTW4_9ACTN|nr:DUF3097 domain-containing protein [Catenulispora pinistramenti]MBS2537076.1 DUF3097 domain-containing protein [Catenulispora pinistramenti]MBS2549477.1 DUF3097 domain-containing protein [Catenulispora pinistramenti]